MNNLEEQKNYLNMINDSNFEKLKRPAQMLKNGEIIVFPTETVYGVGTNAFIKQSINRLYEIKKRPRNKPISILVSNFDMINMCASNISEIEYKVMKAFFPGPLTIILNKKECIPDELTNNTKTVGIRMPDNELTLKLIEYAGIPLATTSANISGKTSGISIDDIYGDFNENVDLYIDSGKSKIGIASTIVKIVNNEPIILREGTITKKQIEDAIKK